MSTTHMPITCSRCQNDKMFDIITKCQNAKKESDNVYVSECVAQPAGVCVQCGASQPKRSRSRLRH